MTYHHHPVHQTLTRLFLTNRPALPLHTGFLVSCGCSNGVITVLSFCLFLPCFQRKPPLLVICFDYWSTLTVVMMSITCRPRLRFSFGLFYSKPCARLVPPPSREGLTYLNEYSTYSFVRGRLSLFPFQFRYFVLFVFLSHRACLFPVFIRQLCPSLLLCFASLVLLTLA